MRLRSLRTLVAGSVALVLLAVGATALAASGSPRSSAAARGQQAVRAVEHGLVAARVVDLSSCPFPPKPPLGDPLAAAAAYLGLSSEQLAQDLKGGKTLAQVASEQGKSVAGLEQALIDAAKADLERSVSSGVITSAQEQQLLGRLRSSIDAFVTGQGGLSIKIAGPAPGFPLGGLFSTAADYLGLSTDQLQHELGSGKSLAEIATEQGKSVEGLKQALMTAATADLAQKVTNLVNEKGLPGQSCGAAVTTEGVKLPALGFGAPASP